MQYHISTITQSQKHLHTEEFIMKKILSIAMALVLMLSCIAAFSSCFKQDKIIVHTNAFFAPFEYYDGTDIVGVDVEIMKLVAEKMNKDVEFVNVEFSAIIDNVKAGEVCDAGAAGITVTEERQEKVDFSIPYYTSVQYVIFSKNDESIVTKTVNGKEYIVWEALAGKKLGTQTDTTGWIYADAEVSEGGVLENTNTEHKSFDNAQLAADAIGANQIDAVIVDELPAQYITKNNADLKCVPLYYSGDTDAEDAPVEEQYAICVTKGNDELLKAINEVLTDLMKKGDDGKSEIEKMVMKHMGFEN